VTGTAGGINQSQVLTQLNNQLGQYGITAAVGSDGQINFAGTTAFTVSTTTADVADEIATTATSAFNNGVYSVAGEGTYTAKIEALTFQNAQGTATVNLTAANTLASAIGAINAQTASLGIYAVDNAAGTGISIQSVNNFSASSNAAAGTFTLTGAQPTVAPTASATATGNALAAITAITNAITQLGNVQSRVGAGENVLNYAINLANSQITNFSSAESGIKDANIAEEASNLTKAQVIQQASVAALAQANSTPQALLKLLQ
jgi:flagellin